MRQRAVTGALLLVGAGVALGATVFRTDIAEATGLAQAVTVDNTPANAVPVREQNRDGNGNIKVHEQGTANVNVTTVLSRSHRRQSTMVAAFCGWSVTATSISRSTQWPAHSRSI